MRIALINPPDRPYNQVQLTSLAIGYLGAYLERAGYECSLYEFAGNTEDPTRLVEMYRLNHFDVVGIAAYTHNFDKVIELAEAIKKAHPGVVVVLGGYHATAMPAEILRDFDCVDYVVVDEGEEALLQLITALSTGQETRAIKNISSRQKDRIQVNPPRDPVKDPGILPFPRRDFVNIQGNKPPYFYNPSRKQKIEILHISSARGCTHRCFFCAVAVGKGNHLRLRSPDSVMEEIYKCMETREYGHIYFVDPDFLSAAERSEEIIYRVHSRWPRVTISFETRADQIVKKEHIIPNLASMGCTIINIGIESGSPSTLLRLGKLTTIEQNEKAIAILHKNGIKPQAFMIMFDAECSLDDLALNIEFMKRNDLYGTLPLTTTIADCLVPLPGTPYRSSFEQKFGKLSPHRLPPPVFLVLEVEEVYRNTAQFLTPICRKADRFFQEVEMLKSTFPQDCVPGFLSYRNEKLLQVLALAVCSGQYAPYFFFAEIVKNFRDNGSLDVEWCKAQGRDIEKKIDTGNAVLRQLEKIMQYKAPANKT